MVDLAVEREHLAKADRAIAQGEKRIAAQALLVDRLRRGRHETEGAEALLLTLRETLEAWKAHRDAILREIARLTRKPAR